MPVYTAADFDRLSDTALQLQQQQWAKSFDKPTASSLIDTWRAFKQVSVAAHASIGGPSKERLAGLVVDAQTYAAAAKAVRLLLDESFHTAKMLRSRDLVLLDWLRLFHTECLVELKHFLGVKHSSDLPRKAEALKQDLAALHKKRMAIDAEILQLDIHTNALAEVKLGLRDHV